MEKRKAAVVDRCCRALIPDFAAGAWTSFLNLLLPPLCHSCRAPLQAPGEIRLCPDCLASVAGIGDPICSCCGRPFATFAGIDHPCGECTLYPPPFLAARSALRYEKRVREMIHSFKYGYRVMLRRPLALLAAPRLDDFVAEFAPELILPVPLHVKRLRQRGFNQAILLGELFSRRWQIPLSRDNLRRVRWTEPQVTLSAAERADNVRGAFSLARAELLEWKRVLLVDDVYTTGSTVKECSRVLAAAGAVTAVVTLARGVD